MIEKPRVLIIVGTRPEIIKMSPIIRAIENDAQLERIFIHSGQHYDFELSKIFIKELKLPSPDLNLHIGSGSHAWQTSHMLLSYEKVFKEYDPDIVLVEGDTNTVLAAGLVAIKLKIPLGHVEAGLRSYDRTMPEEINRQVMQICAEYNFAPNERAALNLLFEGVHPEKIYITGNTIVDACIQNLKIANKKSKIVNELGLSVHDKIVLVTVHRTENVDIKENLEKIVDILSSIKNCKVIFPIHPHTRKKLLEYKLFERLKNVNNMILLNPLGYLDFLKILSISKIVLTDSGGVQEEAFTLKVPCLTLRYNTERPETVEAGLNQLVGRNKITALKYVNNILNNENYVDDFYNIENPYGDGHAGEKIVEILKNASLTGLSMLSKNYIKEGLPHYRLININNKLSEKNVAEVCNILNGTITMIYDNLGRPVFPNKNIVIKKGWNVLLFG